MKTIYTLASIGFWVALLAACVIIPTDEPPGVGEKAEKGYAACEPVIAALETYYAENGSYPDKLAELVPTYIASVPTKTSDLDFSYSKRDNSYALSFHYLGPGMNTCKYTPEKKWNCSGAY